MADEPGFNAENTPVAPAADDRYPATPPAADALVLRRSERGNGRWYLYPPGTSDDTITSGTVECLLTGSARMADGDWDRPNSADYRRAMVLLLGPG